MAERGRPRSFDRDAALRRAMELFWEKGYEATSTAELCHRLGIAAPSLYAAFGSKAELFREAAALYARVEGQEIWGALLERCAARQAVEQFLLRSARSFTRAHQPRGCLIVLGALHADRDGEAARQDLSRRRRENLEMLKGRLDLAVEERELPPNTDTARMARFYITVQQGMSIQARDGAGFEDLKHLADDAMAAWGSWMAEAP